MSFCPLKYLAGFFAGFDGLARGTVIAPPTVPCPAGGTTAIKPLSAKHCSLFVRNSDFLDEPGNNDVLAALADNFAFIVEISIFAVF